LQKAIDFFVGWDLSGESFGMVEKELEMALASIRTLQADLEADKDLELFRIEQGESPVCVADIDRLLEETLNALEASDEAVPSPPAEELEELMGKCFTVAAGDEHADLGAPCFATLDPHTHTSPFLVGVGTNSQGTLDETEGTISEPVPVTPETVPVACFEGNLSSAPIRQLFVPVPMMRNVCIPNLSISAFSVIQAGEQLVQIVSPGSMMSPSAPVIIPYLQVAALSAAGTTLSVAATTNPHPGASIPLVWPHSPEPLLTGSSQGFPPCSPIEMQHRVADGELKRLPPAMAPSHGAARVLAFSPALGGSLTAQTQPPRAGSEGPTVKSKVVKKKPPRVKMGRLGRFSRGACGRWIQRLDQVNAFIARHGHCRIPQVYPEDPDLGQWAKRQRYQYKLFTKEVAGKCSMTRERIAVLGELGFCWDVVKETWDEMYQELVQYVQAFGNTNVPTRMGQYALLGKWVNRQRKNFQKRGRGGEKQKTMTLENFQRLDALGFEWYQAPPRRMKNESRPKNVKAAKSKDKRQDG
jgi:Helicase associated domain